MEVLDGQAQLSNIVLGLVLRESDFTGKMETEITTRTIVQGEVKVMGCLEGEVKIDDELMVGLLEDVGLDDCVFELFLKNEVFLLKCLKGIETSIDVQLGQKDLAKSTRAKRVDDSERRKVYF